MVTARHRIGLFTKDHSEVLRVKRPEIGSGLGRAKFSSVVKNGVAGRRGATGYLYGISIAFILAQNANLALV